MQRLLAALCIYLTLSALTSVCGAAAAMADTKAAPNLPPYKGPPMQAWGIQRKGPATQAKPPQLYFFAITPKASRTPSRVVPAVRVASADRPSPVQGCDAYTYFLSKADANAVTTARAAGAVVQLRTAPKLTGNPVTVCVVSAKQ